VAEEAVQDAERDDQLPTPPPHGSQDPSPTLVRPTTERYNDNAFILPCPQIDPDENSDLCASGPPSLHAPFGLS
jgi:hypothetical protein